MSSPFTCRRIILPGANPLAWLVISTTYPVTAIDGESVTLSLLTAGQASRGPTIWGRTVLIAAASAYST